VLDPADEDLALLAGDRLYAIGLERLAEAGDLHSVAELADVIALGARAHAAADLELADAAWAAGAAAVGWGPDPALAEAKAAAHAGLPRRLGRSWPPRASWPGTWRARAHSPQGTVEALSTLRRR
jgi:hypothetical protein